MDCGSERWQENGRETCVGRISAFGACLCGHFSRSGAGRLFPDPIVLVQCFEPILGFGSQVVQKVDFLTTISGQFSETPDTPMQCFEPILPPGVKMGPEKCVKNHHFFRHFSSTL